MDIASNHREANLEGTSYSLWTKLVGRKSGISKVALGES